MPRGTIIACMATLLPMVFNPLMVRSFSTRVALRPPSQTRGRRKKHDAEQEAVGEISAQGGVHGLRGARHVPEPKGAGGEAKSFVNKGVAGPSRVEIEPGPQALVPA